MIDINSWNFDLQLFAKHNFIIFYGNDFALALSLSRFIESTFQTQESIDILYTDNLFIQNPTIRMIVSAKFLSKLISSYNKEKFAIKCIAIIDGNITSKDNNILYVKCDKLNSRSRAWFIKAHAKQIGLLDIKDNLDWVNNLDDLKFALILSKLDSNFQSTQTNLDFDIWSEVRTYQFQTKSDAKNIWKYFELWCRDNIPNSETMYILSNRISKFLNYKQSKDIST